MLGFNTFSFLRFIKRPQQKGPPPKNYIDVDYDPTTSTIKAIDSDGNAVYFESSATPSTELAAAGTASLTNNTAATPFIGGSVTLTAGTWEVIGYVVFGETNATATTRRVQISRTSGAFDPSYAEGYLDIPTASHFGNISVPVPTLRTTVTENTPIFIVAMCGFTVGTVAFTGGLIARRIA